MVIPSAPPSGLIPCIYYAELMITSITLLVIFVVSFLIIFVVSSNPWLGLGIAAPVTVLLSKGMRCVSGLVHGSY
jgi:hypothetical protein